MSGAFGNVTRHDEDRPANRLERLCDTAMRAMAGDAERRAGDAAIVIVFSDDENRVGLMLEAVDEPRAAVMLRMTAEALMQSVQS